MGKVYFNYSKNNRIKKLRKKKGMTLKELGEAVGMLDSTLSQYETGKRNPKIETWQKLASYFGVSVGYLQGITNDVDEVIFNKAIAEVKKILRASKIAQDDLERLLTNLDLIIANSPAFDLNDLKPPKDKNASGPTESKKLTLDDWYSEIKDAD